MGNSPREVGKRGKWLGKDCPTVLYVKSGDLQRNVAGIIIVYQGKIVTLKVIIDLERGLKKKERKSPTQRHE